MPDCYITEDHLSKKLKKPDPIAASFAKKYIPSKLLKFTPGGSRFLTSPPDKTGPTCPTRESSRKFTKKLLRVGQDFSPVCLIWADGSNLSDPLPIDIEKLNPEVWLQQSGNLDF